VHKYRDKHNTILDPQVVNDIMVGGDRNKQDLKLFMSIEKKIYKG
jgi:hypothetical protein